MRRLLPALLGATLLVGACGGDDENGDRAAVTSIPDETTTSTSTTTEVRTVAPDVIPQDKSQITEEYVESVLNALFEVSAEAIAHTRRSGFVDDRVIELTESVNSRSQARDVLNGLIDLASRSFDGFRAELSPAIADVSNVVHQSRECIFAEVSFDTSGLVAEPEGVPDGIRGFVRLLPATVEQRTAGNPTAWIVDALPATEDGTVPEETCPE